MILKKLTLALALFFASLSTSMADTATHTVGAHGYDLVAYQTKKQAVEGNGNHVAVHDGVTYLFASETDKKAFEANPEKYLPAYGGYCAFGVSVGKKFDGNPRIWKVVNGKLYLNLDKKVQAMWQKDTAGSIKKADANWPQIKDKTPQEL